MNKKLLRKKLALMLATLKKKRRYYCEVEYLESTGTQWIDTGIAPSNITPITKMKFIPTQQYSSGSYGIFGCFGANNTRFQVFYNSIGIGTYVSKSWQANTTYELELNGKVPSATINGSVETSGYSNANGFSSDNMYLFTRNNGNVADSGVPLKLYYCKIWNDGVLVRDFIPVLDWDMTPCMYDRVTEQLFYNQGTGNFIAGREIHPVDYLESTGVEYIDTGYSPSNTTGVYAKIQYVNTTKSDYVAVGTWLSNNRFVAPFRGSSSAGKWYSGWGASEPNTGNAIDTNVHEIYLNYKNDRNISVDSTPISTSISTISGNWKPLFIFSRNLDGTPSGNMVGKIYNVKLTEETEIVRDYIPAIDENDTYFMFDKVSHTCYNNAGTGSFVGPTVQKDGNGKIIENEYE